LDLYAEGRGERQEKQQSLRLGERLDPEVDLPKRLERRAGLPGDQVIFEEFRTKAMSAHRRRDERDRDVLGKTPESMDYHVFDRGEWERVVLGIAEPSLKRSWHLRRAASVP
jgi:hypothetical protein